MERRVSRTVWVGELPIGGGNPVVVQSMTNTRTSDLPTTVAQIRALQAAGCELVRVAVPDMESARAIAKIKREVTVPIAADIHYDPRLAFAALEAGADKLRLNPGNIRDPGKIREIAARAAEKEVPIRVGVNAGSLDARFLKGGEVTPEGMVEAALWEISLLEGVGFRDVVVSLKAAEVGLTVEANRLLAREGDWPLHLGITEPGPDLEGIVKSAVGIGIMLVEGVGDTIRVSLPGDPVREVEAAWEILKALGLRERGPSFVVCPTCGRTGIDIPGIAAEIRRRLSHVAEPLTIAVMGCPVNGLEEVKRADYGILGGKGYGTIYVQGEVARAKVPEHKLVEEFLGVLRGEREGKMGRVNEFQNGS